jgi:colicin import membrane protein
MNNEITVVDETDVFDAALALRDPLILFTDAEILKEILEAIAAAAMVENPDVSTAKGRKEIASMAAKVAKAKVRIDEVGKDYVAELKELPKKVDAGRKFARDYLDNLKEQVRAPLTAYEAEEQAKLDAANALAERQIQEREAAREKELSELRAKVEAQEAAERERKAAEERAQHERQIAEQAKREAEQAAQARIESAEREAKEAAARAEQAIKDAYDRAEQAKRAEEAEREKVALETKRRMEDNAHKATVNRAAADDLMKLGLSLDDARKVITAIVTGAVRNVSVNY